MVRKIIYTALILAIIIGIFFNYLIEKNYDQYLIYINKNAKLINKYCRLYQINPRSYFSIIYGELKNNYDDFDKFDELRARLGFDPSVGFSQMKVSTFMWIEDNYSREAYIMKSSSKDELINKMLNDSLNILYSVFYVKLIMDKISAKYGKELSVKTLASYYGRGIDYYKAEDLDSLYYNQIGITAEKFYYSNMLIEEFPR